MSLLLDALKRAEQEKLARQGTGHEQAHAAHAAEPAAPPPAQDPARRRPLELESHDTPPRTPPAQATAPASAPATARDREGAKTVFAAKQAAPSPAAPAPGGKKAILAIIIGAVLLAIAGGGYVWYEINRTPGPMARGPVPSAPRPVTPAPPPAPAAATPSAAAPVPGAAVPAPPAATAPRKDAVPPVAVLKPGGAEGAPAKAKPEPKAAEQLVMSLLKDAADARPAPPLKLTRTIEPPRVSPEVSQGYEALKRGDPAAARKHYEAALAADPASIDAHLGLATAAARAGDRATATRHYRRVLGLDPKNPSAVAGLAALADLSRPEGLEGQLRADLSRYPQSPALHFTLGNLYASQSRWTEAQAAYFEAYRLDPESADLAYNLAVSLDQLGQSRLAADFYQRALAASGRQAVQFDKGQVSRRIAELKP
ncbi:MAG TPA: tetratricopeptide repeat protein [Usitatibacteraceae bacterium]|nr:tetratricopeptide repeat protein [Usitatibacteraceae bacterium]HRA22860.1 tetratricopeptide repeat protein [Usitatibacteraceae bacterium]